jgi:peptidoglycan/LPS O-acetylase OafA/YrhL
LHDIAITKLRNHAFVHFPFDRLDIFTLVSADHRMPRPDFRADIQGLRAVAVGGVVLVHAGLPGIDGGFAGVDVFFVISGFLITGQLLDLLRAGRLDIVGFYARRVRRLLPAALAVIAATALASAFLLPRVMLPQSLGDAAAAAVYVPNVVLAQRGTDYLADTTPSLYQHFWSLGVEEQFYLIWPLLLLAIAWIARRTRRPHVLPIVLGAIAALSLAACIYETWASQPWAFFPMWTRAWQFACGGLVAVGSSAVTRRLPETMRAVLGWTGLAGIGAAFVVFDATTVYPGSAALLPTLAAAALIAAGDARRGPGLLLRRAPMQWLGRISYSLYLVHWPLLQLAQARVGYDRPLPLRVTLGLAAVAVPVAWALHRFVETPLRLHSRGARPHRGWWRPMLAGLATSAVVASIAVGGSSVAASVPLSSSRDVANAPLTAPPRSTDFVPRSIHPALTAAANDNPPMYADGCELGFLEADPHPCTFGAAGAPRVVLFGDSHAAEWQPALATVAREQGFQLVAQTKSSCRSILEQQPGTEARDLACASWRTQVLDDLAANPPAAVILANFDGAQSSNAAEAAGAWSSGLADTVAALPKTSKVIVLADSPDLGKSPTQCLSQHLEDTSRCAVPAARALHSVGRTAVEASVASTRASYVDLSRYLCDAMCSPIIGDTLVYRDDNHLTATFAAELAAPLGDALEPLLAPA